MKSIKIKNVKQNKCKPFEDFEETVLSKLDNFIKIDLSSIYSDTLLKTVYLTFSCYQSITKWVEKSLATPENTVNEVGGFFLGKYGYENDSKDNLVVSIEKFIAAENVDFSSSVRLNFGIWVLQVLDDYLQEFPDDILLGWFHTHPGHGPFLSTFDLNIHTGFFKEPYHLAIVLDSLTESFETGFFSKQENGVANNADANSTWINWKELFQSKEKNNPNES
ncbi:MAG: hypothetical protein R3E32_01520 [Chitinophagales bacterium]